MTNEEGLGGRDLDDYGLAYDALPFESEQARVRRRLVLERVAKHRPQTLVEVGCAVRPLFVDLPGVRCVVVEPQARFAAAAAAAAEGLDHVQVIQSEVEFAVERIRALVDEVDMVVVSGLLHEVPDAAAVLRAVRALCTPASVVHLNVPNIGSMHRRLGVAMGVHARLDAPSQAQVRLQQGAFYDADRLEAEVSSSGFRTIARGALMVKPFAAAQMQRLLDAGILTTAVIDGLDALAGELPDLASELWLDAVVDA